MISNRLPRTAAALLAAGAWTALSFGALTASAPATAGQAATSTATLAQPSKNARVVAGNTFWSCQGTACVSRETTARPGRLCRDLKRKAGTVVAFTVAGEALDAEALKRCNA